MRGTAPRTECDLRRRHPRSALFDPDPPAGRPPADPDILRTINAHADHCLGVYAHVAKAGTLAEGELLEFEPSDAASAAAAVTQAGTTALKRGALRVFDALMPRGE